VDLLATLGIKPHVVVGHSSGEIAAAYASGAISREEAWEVSYYRGLASASVETRAPDLRGGMLAVGLSEERVLEYIKPIEEQVEVACVNSPNSVTLSGKKDALESLEKLLTANGVFNRALDVSTPYHSLHMKLVEEDYIYSLCSISPTTSERNVTMVSSVTGDIVDGSKLNASYWAQNMVSTVQYASAIKTVSESLENDDRLILIEVGPSPILKTPTNDTLSSCRSHIDPVFLSTMNRRQPSMEYILHLIGSLWTLGHKLNLKSLISRRLSQKRLKCLSTLPSYPWNHDKSYWHESHLSIANRFREFGRQDLIGAPTPDSVLFEPRWRGFLRISENPWIQDHQVQKAIIYPAAGMVSMVLEGAKQLKSHAQGVFGYEIQNMSFEKALIVPNTMHGVEVALNMRLESVHQESLVDGMFSFAIYSKQLDRDWEKHCTGSVKLCSYSENWTTLFQAFDGQFEKVEAGCGAVLNPRQLYEHLDTAGISYGPLFRNILSVKKGHDHLVGRIGIPDTRSKMPANFEYPHLIHPATLDSMFQMLFSLEPVPMVPIYIQSLFISDAVGGDPKSPFTGYAVAEKTNLNQVEAQISMRSEENSSAQLLIKGLRMSGEIFSSSANSSFLPNYRGLCTEVLWREEVASARPTTLKELIELVSHKFPGLSVLQRGGTPSLFISVLLSLSSDIDKPPRLQRYSLVDHGTSDLWEEAIRIAQSSPLAKFIELVSDKSKLHAKYHLIIDCDGADHLAVYLKRDGVLVKAFESPVAHLSDMTITSLPKKDISLGWTAQDIQQEWQKRFASPIKVESMEINGTFTQTRQTQDPAETLKGLVLLVPYDTGNEELAVFLTAFKTHMKKHHPDVDVCTATIDLLADDASLSAGRIVISLLDFGCSNTRGMYIYSWEASEFSSFFKMQRQLKEAIWVIRGAHMAPVNPHASPIIGLFRTLMSEDPRKLFATFDLAPSSQLFDEHVIKLLWVVCQELSKAAQNDEPPELDYAEENGRLYIPRLEPIHSMNQLIEEDDSFSVAVGRSFQAVCDNSGRRADLELAPKTLTTRNGPSTFCFSDRFASELGPDQVEIIYQQAILCVDACSHGYEGMISDFGLAMDIIGQVGAVGINVTQFRPGDKVVGLVPGRTALRTTAKLDVSHVAEYQAGFVPSFFVSAYYGLVYIAKLRRNKTILIHGGASGFSLAALELSLAVGADIYVTVFGEKLDEQRRLLEQRGINSTNIIDASDDSYVAVVNLLTSGKGVDVLYNPTPHHFQSSPRCVKTCESSTSGFFRDTNSPL
jgi:malonyl CoA-acyl carrier protein transacylase